jgi:uncharacterized protein (DUF433 family)
MEFCKEKSHLTALQKAQFEENTTMKSNVTDIPGVGTKTEEILRKKRIYNIEDLINEISNDFSKLCVVTDNARINRHKIFDALECYLPLFNKNQESETPNVIKTIVAAEAAEDSYNFNELQKVSSCSMQ